MECTDKKKHRNTLLRIKNAVELAKQYYEPGNYAKSLHQVWRRHVHPVYPCTYQTFISWWNTDLSELENDLARGKEDKRQLKLFDDESNN